MTEGKTAWMHDNGSGLPAQAAVYDLDIASQ